MADAITEDESGEKKSMKKYIFPLVFILLFFLIFSNWFSFRLIASGDFGFIFRSQYSNFNLFPYAWDYMQGNGIGGFVAPFLWITLNSTIPMTILGRILQLPWPVIERLAYFFPFLIVSLVSFSILFRQIFGKTLFLLLGLLLFMANTYILMVMGGSQVQIGISYALSPLTLFALIHTVNKCFRGDGIRNVLFTSVLSGLAIALQVLVDPRMFYITLVGAGMYLVVKFICEFRIADYGLQAIRLLYSIFFVFVVPGIVAVLLHAFWLFPTLLHHTSPLAQLGSAYDSAGAVKFFSFATFENTLSLLHPNWPENIFGKIYFMRPEFLLLPILAFSSLFFINGKRKTENDNPASHELRKGKEKRLPLDSTSLTIAMTDENLYVIFFALLGLLGAFLAKGANDPFGGIYLWLFVHDPGFVMFRDPTKWYLLIAISYSMLIPFTVSKIYDWLSKKFKN